MSKLNKILIIVLVLLLGALGASNFLKKGNPFAKNISTEKDLSIILVTFGERDDKGIWQGEIAPYMEQLKEEKEISAQVPQCIRSFEGKIYNQNVIVAVTGTGKINGYACSSAILEREKSRIKEVYISGIAGVTPVKGSTPVMIGDVCVASAAVDFDLQYYGADKANSEFLEPMFWTRDANTAPQKTTIDSKLALALMEANKEAEVIDKEYELDSVTNTLYHNASRSPRLWGPTDCVEVSGDLFWHDSNSDKKAREIGASLLSNITNSQISSNDIFVASAMESVSVGKAVSDWNKHNKDTIKFAIIRSASNFDQPPRGDNTLPKFSSKESLENNLREENVELALITQAVPVLNTLKARGTEQTRNKNQIDY